MTQEVNTKPVGGFAAIQPSRPGGQYAIKRVIIGPDGRPRVVTVDARTGQQLENTNGYTVAENNTVWQPPQQEQAQPQTPTVADTVVQKSLPEPPPDPKRINEGGRDTAPAELGQGRSPANAFGYIDKPGIVKAASFAPGMIGMAGKAINAGINVNNTFAADAARDMMDVPQMSAFEKALGAFRDNQGQVGDYQVGDETYSVGMEALNPKTGVTNLTPDEAAKRAFANKVTLTPSTKAQVKQHKQENESLKGNRFQGLIDKTRSFIDSLFSGSDDSQNNYPDKPNKPDTPISGESLAGRAGWASEAEANRGGGGVTSGGTGLW